MNKGKRIGRIMLCLVVSLMMVMTMIPSLPTGMAFAAVGSTPPHTKNITDNQDGTYTISLDIVGEAEKQPNNVNVTVVFDRSGSMTTQRMNAAKTAVNNLANSLFAYNTQSAPNTVQMALVSFSTNATITRQPTTSYSQFSQSVNGLTANGGTNWEAALDEAGDVNFGDDDQTFVIFVSDGNPTFRDTRITTDYLPRNDNPNWSNTDWNTYRNDNYFYNSDSVYGLGSDNPNQDNYSPTSMNRCYEAALPNAQAIVADVGGDHFFTIGAYGDVSRMQTLTTAAGAPAANFYNANDTAALNQALADILAKIEMMGFADAEIDDGTTNQVTTTSGKVAELLELVPNFKYYRSGGSYGTMQPWTDAPEAEIVNGEVVWNLSDEGVLENGVRYTVTFDCYPSQYTYDTIAQLKNGDMTDAQLAAEGLDQYIVKTGEGAYSLRTNTNAGIKWDDTRDDAGRQESAYTNPDPVATSADSLPINKEWVGADPDVDEVEITVIMDEGTANEEEFHTATLTKDNNWSTSAFISVGIIKNGEPLPGAMGHDFSFAELDDTQYHWEIDAPVVRPMLINGGGENHLPTMLIKVDEKHPVPSGAETYTIDGSTYYVDSSAVGLTATNHRRSNLNLSKTVTGEDAPEDATFPFTLTVNNSLAPKEEPTDDPEHGSDYWVWFSIYDTKAGQNVKDATIGNATLSIDERTGDYYYYAKSGSAITVEMKDGWNLRFTNLPSGSTYTFVEGDLTDGFAFNKAELTSGVDSTFSGNQTTTGTIEKTQTAYQVVYTNDYELTDLEITKVWEDNEDQDGKRLTADELKAKLTLSPAVEGKEPTVVDNEDGTYTITYTGLPRYNNGQEVTYTVAESAIDGYETTGSPAKDHGTITNTHEPEVIDITVKKEWVGPEAEGGAEVTLKAGGTAVSGQGITNPVTLSSSNNNTYTWEDLPKYANGEEIEYTVEETAIDGYSTTGPTGTGTAEDPFVFTNTNDETTEVYVKKVWIGPESTATIHLLANGVDTEKSVTLPNQGSNEYTFENLRKYDATTGEEITYTVTEDTVSGYTTTGPTGSGTETAPYTFTNTNDEKTTISVEKVWDDDNDRDGKRPDSVTVHLKVNGQDVTQEGITAVQTLDEDNDWAYTWEGLYKYDQTTGAEITYTVTEDTVTDYTPKAGDPAGSGTEDDPYVFTNSYEPGKTSVTVTKAWSDDDDRDGIRPSSVEVTLLADGEAVTQEGIIAAQTLNEDNSWTYTWTGLNQKEAGTDIVYTVEETTTNVINGTDGPGTYAIAVTGDATEGFTVTNSHTPETVEVPVEKVWEDADDQDGIRPTSVEVTLLADGTAVTQEGITAAQTLNEGNDWAYTWEDLYKYDDGEEIVYTVEETETAVITGTDGAGTYAYEVTGDAEDGYTVTNTHTPEVVEVSVEKVWEDADDQDGIRPASVTVTLLADGAAVTQEGITAAQTLDEDNDWAYTWEGLNKYADGEEIEYTVEETETAVITGTDGAGTYAYEVTGDAEDGYTVTNTHTPETIEVPVEKVWSDGDDQDGIRPDSVEVTLLADGEAVTQTGITAAQTLSESNSWSYTWEGLNKYADGEEITYTVVETTDDVITGTDGPGTYAISYSGDVEEGLVVTNTHTPEVVEASVKKVWDDNNNQDGFRPQSLVVTLSDGQTVTLSESNNWTATITDLPKYDDGELITYTWTEASIEDYTLISNETVGTLTTLTNKHTPEVTEASVKKVWDDADNQDGIRPLSLVVTLSDGQTVTLDESNNWTGKITGLDKYKDGELITYTWTEADIDDYTLINTATEGTLTTLTNQHTPEQTKATVKKVWDDADNQDGFRPDDLTVKLLADGVDTGKSVTLSESNNWTDTIEELDKFKAGAEISYTWDEGKIEKYTLSKTEKDPADATITTLTNTHEPEKVVVEVEKVWEDADNQDGIRPNSVTVKLLADGEDVTQEGVVATQTLSESNSWKYTWEDLDKYSEGKEIEYTVEEVEVPEGYEADVTGNAAPADEEESDEPKPIGYIVTNTHEPELIDITVLKVWEDVDDQDGFRPEDVTISLLADGEDTGKTVSLTETNQWTNTFTDLYKYKVGAVGQEVVYTIDESEVPEGYEVAIEGTVEDGFTVTNSHTPEVVEVSVEKVWDDADDRDGIRPDSVTVTLLANGDDVTQEGITATVELNEENNWKYTWEGLNKRAAGQVISYTVKEEPVPEGYEAEITGDAEKGFTVKNFHLAKPVPVMIDPPVKKVVKGNPSKDETFTFQMKAVTEGAPMPEGAKDGVMTMDIVGSGEKEFGEAWFNEAGTYVYEITEVDGKVANYKYDGTVYTLTVEVKEVADGTQVKLVKTETVKGGNGQIVFTNTYEEPPVPTGDTTIVVPYIVIGVSALILLLMLLFRTRKNRA